jgi:hypothetical protein
VYCSQYLGECAEYYMENMLTSVWGWVYSWLQLVNAFVFSEEFSEVFDPFFVPNRSVGMISCSSSCRRCLCSLNSGHSDRIYIYWFGLLHHMGMICLPGC